LETQQNNVLDSNLIYVNRNESFINTASKLLEKVKMHHGSLTNLPTIVQQQHLTTTNNIYNLQVLPSKNQINKKK
jgi:hypothetical protein